MSHNIPAGGAARDYYDEVYGRDEGPDVDAELDLESLADTERPSDRRLVTFPASGDSR